MRLNSDTLIEFDGLQGERKKKKKKNVLSNRFYTLQSFAICSAQSVKQDKG